MDNFHMALAKHGLKNTPQRNHIFKSLLANGTLTNKELADSLHGIVDRATVYRTIKQLENLRLVTRIWNGWKSKIELSEQFISHHHHATCMRCNQSFRIESDELEKVISHLANEINFNITNHTMEIDGICKNCI